MIGDDQLQRTSDTARESQGLSADVDGHRDPQHPEVRVRGVMTERYSEEGVPQAVRSRHRQISCETCCLRLEQHQRHWQCSGCRHWTHEGCTEQFDFGTKWHADMCSTCMQRATRTLRVVSVVELSQGHHWNQDEWFGYPPEPLK